MGRQCRPGQGARSARRIVRWRVSISARSDLALDAQYLSIRYTERLTELVTLK